jgi:hypothetical protein
MVRFSFLHLEQMVNGGRNTCAINPHNTSTSLNYPSIVFFIERTKSLQFKELCLLQDVSTPPPFSNHFGGFNNREAIGPYNVPVTEGERHLYLDLKEKVSIYN